MSVDLPLSALAAWWATAWLRGDAAADDVLGTTLGLDELTELRRSGATGVGLALPVDGDPLGLGGPAEFNLAALEAGEAAISDSGIALIPGAGAERNRWIRFAANKRQLPDLGEADRGLRAALPESANALVELDVAQWRPEVADEIMELARPAHLDPPPGIPQRCADLAARAARCLGIVDLALQDDGGTVSASEADLRRRALLPLERASRRALVAACSPEAWPPV